MQYTNPKYTYRKDGVFYFSKQVPSDVRSYYTKQCIVLCLRTKSSAQAQQASIAVLAKLEDYWLELRIKDLDVPSSHLLNESLSVTAGMPTIEDALNKWIKQVAGFDNVIRVLDTALRTASGLCQHRST